MTTEQRPREWMIMPERGIIQQHVPLDAAHHYVRVIEHSAYEDLTTKLQRTVNAAFSALLEFSAWMGIPEGKRALRIHELMENVRFCAEHDLREQDESQRNSLLAAKLTLAKVALGNIVERCHDHRKVNTSVEMIALRALEELK